MLSFKFS